MLDQVVSERGWKRRIGLSTVLRRWSDLVGESNAEHSRPVDYQDGVLVVECDSTAWAQAMRYTASKLVARLNRELGDRTVLRVDFRGPAAPSWKKGPRSVQGRGPGTPTGERGGALGGPPDRCPRRWAPVYQAPGDYSSLLTLSLWEDVA
ncbi:DUF721 domain-containing protein [Tessaracoccus sp. HDW20]|uniref:DUF721 domain-containing protein n=1 Tax=Tessaracoccus coleopterorum TaxID=2714950 RepID=UPI0018D43287|nr:DUF721 domain-containing protein [Tessaracoccus coleopterorum]